jgi:hypothetical protein
MYLLWQPTGDSTIPVPVAKVAWNVKGTAANSGTAWRLSGSEDAVPATTRSKDDNNKTHGLPTWGTLVTDKNPAAH